MSDTKTNSYVLLSDGLPLEVLDQLLIELRNVSDHMNRLERLNESRISLMEAAFVGHLRDCHE